MTIIIFIIVLAVLIFVHELGHFLFAKWSGMRVDEFAIGFPPRLFSKQVGETRYSLNLIPFGGYVKIPGEDYTEAMEEGGEDPKLFFNKPKWQQAVVLFAGVLFNLLLAWILISIGFMSGLPSSASIETDYEVRNPEIVLVSVLPNTPAEEAGLKPGDALLSIASESANISKPFEVEEVQNFIRETEGPLEVTFDRGGEVETVSVSPEEGIISEGRAFGVNLDKVGVAKLGFFQSLWEGAKLTISLTGRVVIGLWGLLTDAFVGDADLANVAGPIGIAGLVGDASRLGFVYLLSFTAFISINLVILNLIPFPALDGGRLLFVLIEKIKGSPINPKIANTLNVIGFALLILLMVVVTVNDVIRIL